MNARLFSGCVLFALGCAHTKEPELTATEHRNEAAIHQAAAEAERAKFDPLDRRTLPERNESVGNDPWTRVYNPTASHLEAADREMKEAAGHLAAARQLEAFADRHCAEIPPEQRAACPLLASSVTVVRETKYGVMLELKPAADAVDIVHRLDCHLAWAVAKGFDRPSCPLFVKGMQVALVLGNGKSISMSSDDPAVALELRAQARRIFTGEQPVSAAPRKEP